jgi:glycosyltransferase involved in cell wall biosynthesis
MNKHFDNNKRILVIDFCNYEDYPIGGYLSFAKNLMGCFGHDLALVGIATQHNDPVGKWFQKDINGCKYDFFAIARYNKSKTKHLIPDRLAGFLLVNYFKKRIFKIDIKNIFIRRQELLLSIAGSNCRNICYSFAGLENPLNISKYRYAGHIANLFEWFFFKRLKFVKTILASGDENAIDEMIQRSNGEVSKQSIIKFPTRINTDIFRPLSRVEVRKELNLSNTATILITTGRLAPLKGWKFMIDCFILFEKEVSNSKFYFIGEGEEYKKIQDYIAKNNLTEKVLLVGEKKSEEIALFLNASDLFIMGSYKEGWSTSLIEAIACGIPACVTNFSSAKDIIIEGENGYVIDEHNTEMFAKGMLRAVEMPSPVYNDNVMEYGVNKLKEELLKIWELI